MILDNPTVGAAGNYDLISDDGDENSDDLEEEARQWSDQCIYECRICNSVSYANYASLFDHIRFQYC
jgi:hypothetical protein